MDTNTKFIYTVSRESADILKQNGFSLIQEGGGFWVFLNDKKINFEKLKYITFSNNYFG
jgi:hypothetical protein